MIANKERFTLLAEALVRGLLREAIGYRVEYPIPYLKGTVGYMVEAPLLWIRQSRFPILFVSYDRQNADLLETLVQQLEIAKATEFFALLIVVPPPDGATGREAEELRHVVGDSVYRHDFVVLDREHLARIIADNSSKRLVESILEQGIELTALSPYVVRGPVPDNMFFGREREVKAISQSILRADHAVVGGRRIGKSSILLRLTRLLNDGPRYRAIYMDCEARFDYKDFFAGLNDLGVVMASDAEPLSFGRAAAALRDKSEGRQVVLLLDEVDELLAFDAAQQPSGRLFRALRAASQEGLCRFVFSGSRTLYRHLRDASSPFFNFCEHVTLRPLEEKSIAEIVRKPMHQLGIEMPDEDRLIARLIELTSCHPNIAQWVCNHLVKSSQSRRITLETLEQMAKTNPFQEHYVSTAWGDATPLEKLITLLMEGPSFSHDDVRRQLAHYDLGDDAALREATDVLQLYSIVERDGVRYRFALTQFPRIVRESDLTAQIETFAGEARSRCS